MAIITLTEIHEYLGIGSADADDDTLLASQIIAAQRIIEIATGKIFDAGTKTTRYFTWGVDTGRRGDEARVLYLDEDLAEIYAITNGDGNTITTGNYNLLPLNNPPYRQIKLKLSASSLWTYATDPEGAIAVEGYWGWSKTAPEDIKHIAKRIVGFFYRQKDAQTYDLTGFSELGQIRVKHRIPEDILQFLEFYVERVYR